MERGPRELIIAMLEERVEPERARGRDDLALACRAGARLIREGRPYVWVGGIKYVVTGD